MISCWKPSCLRRLFAFLLLAITALVAPTGSIGQVTGTSNPCGYNAVTCLSNSDTILSVPVAQPAAYSGSVASVSTNVITLSGTPGWANSQFVYVQGTQPSTYYVIFTSGAKAGSYYTVTANTSGALTVNLNGDTLSSVVAGDQTSVIAYWTLGTAFPAADAGASFTISASPLALQTQIMFPNHTAAGINNSSSATYFYYNSAWRKVGQPVATSFNDTALIPDGYFTLRNKATATTFSPQGAVVMNRVSTALDTQQSSKQDNYVAITRPIPVSLNQSGLISSGAFLSSASPLNHADELQCFDNTVTGVNKSAAVTYFYYNGAWRKVGQPVTTDFGNDQALVPGSGAIVRKGATASGAQSLAWTNDKNY